MQFLKKFSYQPEVYFILTVKTWSYPTERSKKNDTWTSFHISQLGRGHTVNNSNGPARPVTSHKHLTLGIVKHHLHNRPLKSLFCQEKQEKKANSTLTKGNDDPFSRCILKEPQQNSKHCKRQKRGEKKKKKSEAQLRVRFKLFTYR